jgi:hypothetical protein
MLLRERGLSGGRATATAVCGRERPGTRTQPGRRAVGSHAGVRQI